MKPALYAIVGAVLGLLLTYVVCAGPSWWPGDWSPWRQLMFVLSATTVACVGLVLGAAMGEGE